MSNGLVSFIAPYRSSSFPFGTGASVCRLQTFPMYYLCLTKGR